MAYDEAGKAAAKAHVDAIRAVTVCARCGRQPIEWHNPEHETKYQRRIAQMVVRGFPPHLIDKEIASCEPLCRSCHMKEDGRLVQLMEAHEKWAKKARTDPKPCSACGKLTKPMWRGMCHRCYEAERWRNRKK